MGKFTFNSNEESWMDAALKAAEDPASGVCLVEVSEEELNLHGMPVRRVRRRVCDAETKEALEEDECKRRLRPYHDTINATWREVDWWRWWTPITAKRLAELVKKQLVMPTAVDRLRFGGGKV